MQKQLYSVHLNGLPHTPRTWMLSVWNTITVGYRLEVGLIPETDLCVCVCVCVCVVCILLVEVCCAKALRITLLC